MNAEEILKNIENINIEDKPTKEHERLSAVVVGGNSKQYLGKEFQLSEIDSMSEEEIKKLHCKYEARLGASMTKTLGNTFINLYVVGLQKYFNVINPPKLIQDLKEDPFVNQALTNTCCELYYRFGMYLAPFTAMLTTIKHIDTIKDENNDIENDD